jgi:hypothetical protein
MKFQSVKKCNMALSLLLFSFLGSISHVSSVRAVEEVVSMEPVNAFCNELVNLLCGSNPPPLDTEIDLLLSIISKSPKSFVKQLGGEGRLAALVATLKQIKQRAQAGTIGSIEIGRLLNQFVPYLPETAQKKLNLGSWFSLLSLGKNISKSLAAMKKG